MNITNETEQMPVASKSHEGKPDPVDGASLLDELTALIRRFAVLPLSAAETLALWIIHTYGFHLRDVTTYIALESPEKRCGKTTLLALLAQLVNRPIVAANISPPAMFYAIEDIQPTLLIDEADTFLRGNHVLRGILNSGYTRATAYVLRVAKSRKNGSPTPPHPETPAHSDAPFHSENGTRLARFSSWCPKAMATIGHLPETLADRSIVIKMNRKLPGETCDKLRTLKDPRSWRRCCLRFVQDHEKEIAAGTPEIPQELNDRAADIWEPLFAIADIAGGEWPEKARQAAIALSAVPQDHNPDAAFFLELKLIFSASRADRIASRDLVASLNQRLDQPWAEHRHCRAVDHLWLSQHLARYSIRPKTMRFGHDLARGYLKEDFQQIFQRYIPRSDLEKAARDVMQTLAEAISPFQDQITPSASTVATPADCQKE